MDGQDSDAWTHGALFFFGTGILAILIGSSLVAFIALEANLSGVPDIIGYLNGAKITGLLDLKVLVVKVLSTILSTATLLSLGNMGPLVHIGAIIGSLVSRWMEKAKHHVNAAKLRFRVLTLITSDSDERNSIG